jgi:hypothetical protein
MAHPADDQLGPGDGDRGGSHAWRRKLCHSARSSRELASRPGDHTAAYARYQEVLAPYVQQCQALPPRGVQGFAPNRALMIKLRNASMNMMTRWPMKAMFAKQFSKADGIVLPDYTTSPRDLRGAAMGDA